MTKIYLVKHYMKEIAEPYHYTAFTNKKKALQYSELENIKINKYKYHGYRTEVEEIRIHTFSSEEELQKLKGAE